MDEVQVKFKGPLIDAGLEGGFAVTTILFIIESLPAGLKTSNLIIFVPVVE